MQGSTLAAPGLDGHRRAGAAGKSASDWSLRFQVQFLIPKF